MCLSNMFLVQFEDAISGGYFMAIFAIMMTCKHNFGILCDEKCDSEMYLSTRTKKVAKKATFLSSQAALS